MPNYLRSYVPGGTFFFTIVTQERRRILTTALARMLLRDSIAEELEVAPFALDAIVLLPDHLHAVWTLPEGDTDYSTQWRRIKERFTRRYLANGGAEASRTIARVIKGERGIWQPRFWEHTIRDESDLERCIDYLHFNPVKHGLVATVRDYPWSTFHRFVERGIYPHDWGDGQETHPMHGAEWD